MTEGVPVERTGADGFIHINMSPYMKNLQPQGAKEPNPDISVEQLKADVDMGDKMLKQLRSLLEFEIFNDTGILMVRIKDSQSGEVIRTMPPQEYLILKGKLKAFIGILLNEKI